MKIEQETVIVWEPGMYEAKVTAVEQTESTWPGKEGTPRFKFVLRVKSTDGEEYNDLWYFTGTRLSKQPRALLPPFVKALRPDINLDDPNVDLDTDDLIGRRCRVVLGINEEKGRNTIDKVLPVQTRTVPKQAAAPVKAAPEDDGEPDLEDPNAKPF